MSQKKFDNLRICERNNGQRFKQVFFRHRSWKTAQTMQTNKNTVKSTTFWLSVWKKWCLEKGIAKEIENYEPTQLNTLLKRSNVGIKNKRG